MMTKAQLPELLESFFRQRLALQRGASPATIATYRDALRLLVVFAAQRIGKPPSRLAIEDLDRDVVLAFLDHLEQERGNGTRTRNARLAAIRAFFHHVVYHDPGHMGISQRILAIPGKRATRPALDYLRHEELEAILCAPDRTTLQGRRDHALLLFLGRTGARVSEAIGINVADLRLDKPFQVLLRGKGRKERIVPLDEATARVVRALCAENPAPRDHTAPVFINARGQRLSRHGVIHILQRTARIAASRCPALSDRCISPHTLRHTVAMHLLQAGVDLATIQAWLGHADLRTTHHYLEADMEMKQRALEKCTIGDAAPLRYQPKDKLLALLDDL
jgi:integrase/recombinase XerD